MPETTETKTETKVKETETIEIDPKIAEIQKDPDAVSALLKAKREANDEAKKLRLKLEDIDKAKKANDDKALAEQGKYKELLEKKDSEFVTLKTAFQKKLARIEIMREAAVQGALDTEAIAALADLKTLKISDDLETIEGVTELVAAIKKSKPALFGKADDSKKVISQQDTKASLQGVFVPADGSVKGLDRIAAGMANKK